MRWELCFGSWGAPGVGDVPQLLGIPWGGIVIYLSSSGSSGVGNHRRPGVENECLGSSRPSPGVGDLPWILGPPGVGNVPRNLGALWGGRCASDPRGPLGWGRTVYEGWVGINEGGVGTQMKYHPTPPRQLSYPTPP